MINTNLSHKPEKDQISSFPKEEPIEFTPTQLEMLEMSVEDIREGRTISHEDLIKETKQWLDQYSPS